MSDPCYEKGKVVFQLPRNLKSARILSNYRTRPYFADLLMALTYVDVPEMKTFSVDNRGRLYFGLAALEEWTVEEVAAVLGHEAEHIFRKHCMRASMVLAQYEGTSRFQLAMKIWGLACDAEINDDEERYSSNLPGNCVYPRNFIQVVLHRIYSNPERHPRYAETCETGKMAEAYFKIGMKLLEDSGEDGDDGLKKKPQGGEDGDSPGTPGDGDGGSGVDGQPREWELGEVDGDSEGLNRGDLKDLINETSQKIVAQKGTGKVSASLVREATRELSPPKIPWQQTLSAIVRHAVEKAAGASDYTFRRRSRRAAALPKEIVYPAMHKPIPNITFGTDTSASMDDKILTEVLSEIEGVLSACGSSAGITVISGDTDVKTKQRVRSVSRVEFGGGGGTDMRRLFQCVGEARPRANIFILATDGLTPWPDNPLPGIHTIVCHCGDYRCSPADIPDWITVVELPQ